MKHIPILKRNTNARAYITRAQNHTTQQPTAVTRRLRDERQRLDGGEKKDRRIVLIALNIQRAVIISVGSRGGRGNMPATQLTAQQLTREGNNIRMSVR